jgi:hypothetical protein
LWLKPITAYCKLNVRETLSTKKSQEFPVEEDFRIKPSVLADLGPLPDVVESNSETAWSMFLQLEGRQPRPVGVVCIDDVMALARRFNRICPVESEWLRLQALLAECGGSAAPDAVQGAAFRRMPPLVKRTAVRDQVEWAAERGCLTEVYAFLEALPEDCWTHMGD